MRLVNYLAALCWHLSAFSPCGTHLPADRLGFLARAETIYGVFDADEAGQDASARFAVVLGERWRPVPLPRGAKDLSALAAQPGGRARFFASLAAARGRQCATGDQPSLDTEVAHGVPR